MSNVNKNITVEAKLISPPTYNKNAHFYTTACLSFCFQVTQYILIGGESFRADATNKNISCPIYFERR